MSLLDIVDSLDLGDDAEGMAEFMKAVYPLLFGAAYDQASDELPVDVSFDVTNPQIQKTIDKLATRIGGVPDTVKDLVRGIVGNALEGEEVTDAEGNTRTVIPSAKEIAARIREAGATDKVYRSVLIARTETATAMNLGATHAYEDAGVEKVEVLDGDGDEICASVNGTTQTLEWARSNPIGHPGCTRAFAPVVE